VTYLLLYVDDILLFSKKMENINDAKSLLKSHFAVKDLGEARHFLGMQITFERDGEGKLLAVKLSNEKLITDMLDSFNMTLRYLLSLLYIRDERHQMDVSTTFLHGNLQRRLCARTKGSMWGTHKPWLRRLYTKPSMSARPQGPGTPHLLECLPSAGYVVAN
jgi:hypothetical protein